MNRIFKIELEKKRMYQLSAGFTLMFMLTVFVVAQIITYRGLSKDDELQQKRMQVQELIKLEFLPRPEETPKRFSQTPTRITVEKKSANFRKEAQAVPQEATPSVAAISGGFDLQKLITRRSVSARRGGGGQQNPEHTGVSVATENQVSSILDLDSDQAYSDKHAPMTASKRGVAGGGSGLRVAVGAGRGPGAGTNGLGVAGDGLDGAAFTGSGSGKGRSVRGTGTGNGDARITLPSVAGGDDAAIDLHALIKWMKAHPGPIPKLVAYDMGHRGDDLSSSVPFTLGGRQYRLYLSCNEMELLLRICMVEAEDYTLLKDNGIKESSNYLTVGDVVKKAGDIQSLISSRQAPAERADRFYQIFWSWWQQQDIG